MQWLLWHLASAQATAALLSPWERQAGVGTRTAPAASWGDPMPTASGWIAQMYPVHVVHRGLDLRPGKPLQPGSSSRKAVTLNTAFVGPRAGTGSNLPLGLASTQAGRGAAGYTC